MKQFRMCKTLLYILTITSLTCACTSTKIRKFSKYEPAAISKATYVPNEEALHNTNPKVVIFPFETGNMHLAQQTNINATITSSIENILTKDSLADLVDRKAAVNLQEEIALAEMKKTGSYKGPDVAEYAIDGTIGKLSFESKFKEETNYYDPVSMQHYHYPAKFIYTAEVGGVVKIHEIPSLKVVKTFKFKGKKVKSEDVKTNREGVLFGMITTRTERGSAKKLDPGMVQEAAKRAIENQSVEFKNFFAKRGYIIDKKQKGSKSIFKINLGIVDGIEPGDKFDIITKLPDHNQLTGKTNITTTKIAEGVISKEISSNSCWIKIKSKKDAEKIRLGDIVKMKYKRSFGSKLKNMTTAIADTY